MHDVYTQQIGRGEDDKYFEIRVPMARIYVTMPNSL